LEKDNVIYVDLGLALLLEATADTSEAVSAARARTCQDEEAKDSIKMSLTGRSQWGEYGG
jgi:hypothetical protein